MISRLPIARDWAILSPARRREAISGYLFISPWLIGFLIFFVGPILTSLVLSFTTWNIVGEPVWIGLKNYEDIFLSDARFGKALQVTLTYAVLYLPLEVICGVASIT